MMCDVAERAGDLDAAGSLPSTSLIVCSRNRPEMLEETVRSILAGADVPTELIIVDQSDQLNVQLESLGASRGGTIRYIWSESIGSSRANQFGIASARYDLLVFTHDDVRVAPEWFGTLVRSLVRAGSWSVVTGRVPVADELPDGFQLTAKTDEMPAVYKGRLGKDVLYPLNMAMFRSSVEAVGGFDVRLGPGTRFPAAEDNDLGFRLLESGHQIVYVPQAVLYHRAWRGTSDFLPLRWSYGVGRGGFYAKHLHLHDHYMLKRMARDIATHMLLSLRGARHERTRAFGDVVLVIGILYGATRWMLTQQRVS